MPNKSDKISYVKLIKQTPSKNLDYVFISITFIFAALLIVFAIKPTITTVLTINKEIKEKERVHSALNNKMSALSALDGKYNENKEKFNDLVLIYPTSGNFSLFLSNIEAVAARNNFVLESVNFSDYENEGFDVSTSVLKPWSVRLSVSGKKSSLQNLFKDFEAMPMYPVIEGLSYTEKVDENGNIRYSITLRIYHIENKLFYQ